MSLEEILNDRLKPLYKKEKKTSKILMSNNKKLKEFLDDIELISIFIEEVSVIDNIRSVDTNVITDLLVKYKIVDDYSIEDDLNSIKVLLSGIYDKKLKMSLNQEQIDKLKEYISYVYRLLDELNERKSRLEDSISSIQDDDDMYISEITSLQELIEKIKDKDNNELLNQEDLDIIKEIINDSSVLLEVKKELLIRFIEYNNARKNGETKENKTDINEVISVFNEFNIDMSSVIKKYKSEVEVYANISNIRQILSFMMKTDIINKFNNVDLLTICLHGNYESVSDTYDEISKKDSSDFYYTIPSAWVNNLESKKIRKKKYKGQETKEKSSISLKQLSSIISREEIDKNINYLQNEGFVFDIYDIGSRKTIMTSHYKLKENVNALKQYGIITEENISRFKIWLLSENQIVEKLDRFIELGLLSGHNSPVEFANYLKRYPGQLHNMLYPTYMLLYNAKQTYSNESYYTTIASNKKGQLSGYLNSGVLGDILSTPDSILEYKKTNFIEPNTYIDNYDSYEEIIDSNYDVKINKDIFNNPEIQNLEKNYSIEGNQFVYVFDGVVISRLKVLRNYSLINDGKIESLMSSIVNGSFLTQESVNKIAKCINYSLGGAQWTI